MPVVLRLENMKHAEMEGCQPACGVLHGFCLILCSAELLVHLSAPLFDFCSKGLNRSCTAVSWWRFFRLVAGGNVYRNECGRRTE